MAHPILMPKPGQMTEECTVVAWHKQEGDPVQQGRRPLRDRDRQVDDGGRGVRRRRPPPDRSSEAGDDRPGEHGLRLHRRARRGDPRDAPGGRRRRHGRPGRRRSAPRSAGGRAPAVTRRCAPPAPRRRVRDVRDRRRRPRRPAPPRRPTAARISPRASRLAAEAGIDPRAITGTRSRRPDRRARRPRRHRDAGGAPGDHPADPAWPGRGCRPGSPRRWPAPVAMPCRRRRSTARRSRGR